MEPLGNPRRRGVVFVVIAFDWPPRRRPRVQFDSTPKTPAIRRFVVAYNKSVTSPNWDDDADAVCS